jgi:hypothetical protein
MLSTIMGLIGLSPTSLIAIGSGILAALAWLWNTKRVSFNKGVAEERAKTDAANNQLIKDKLDAIQAVDRLPPVDARRELSEWSKG